MIIALSKAKKKREDICTDFIVRISARRISAFLANTMERATMPKCRVGDCQKSRENLDKKRIIYVVHFAKSMLLVITSHFKMLFEPNPRVFSHFSAIYFAVLINIKFLVTINFTY